jgi:uncharacterized protein (DUF486 family)
LVFVFAWYQLKKYFRFPKSLTNLTATFAFSGEYLIVRDSDLTVFLLLSKEDSLLICTIREMLDVIGLPVFRLFSIHSQKHYAHKSLKMQKKEGEVRRGETNKRSN